MYSLKANLISTVCRSKAVTQQTTVYTPNTNYSQTEKTLLFLVKVFGLVIAFFILWIYITMDHFLF